MREVGLGVGIDEGGLDAESLPLVCNRHHRVAVVVRGVVADLNLQRLAAGAVAGFLQHGLGLVFAVDRRHGGVLGLGRLADRKSTRLNSSHTNISYAVFCLKKKKIQTSAYQYAVP